MFYQGNLKGIGFPPQKKGIGFSPQKNVTLITGLLSSPALGSLELPQTTLR